MTSTPFLKSSLWFAIALSLVVEAGPARGDAPPEVYVPHSRVAVDLDGKLSAAEWDDAATVADLRLTATQQPLQPGTRFYLKWNQGNLLVGVRCFETAPNYPKASRRNPTDLLTDDDAVQVILGTADQLALSPEVLKVGGYPGAMDEPPPRPDHYYAFSVNSAGSVSRTYNEGPLRRPLFKAAASQAAGAWTVEMRIPFASAGIDHPTGGPIYANLFRFRPPDMAAWYSRSFGGYVPMPFAKLHVLPRGQHSQRTLEPPPETTHQPPAESPWSAKLHWYPLASRVAAEVTGPSHSKGATARLSAEGVPATEARLSADGQTRLILVVPPAAKLPAEAKLVIKAPDGTLLHSESCRLTPVDRPSWLGTQVAKEYLTERVPKPWTRPQVTDSAVQLKHSRLAFGTHGLVESVSGKWGELLAGEGQIVLETATGKVALEPVSREVLPGATSVQIDSELRFDGGTVEVRATVDYDGFTIYKLRVRDLPPQAIEHLAVQVPLRKAHARFVHQFHVQGTRGLTGAGWEGKAGPVWVGGQEAGLAFNYDIYPFLSADRRTQIDVLEQNKQTWLRVNLVD
ncbi:MAG: DUF6067 family protein, partial [Pirellulales bacterium]|nr:DUF6067 family protein [Pirellulales bacterium]